MKIYIADKNKVKKYKLPDSVEESFLISYISDVDKETKSIYVQAIDGSWHIKKNENIYLYDGQNQVDEILLIEHKTFCMNFTDSDEYVFLFCESSLMDSFKDYLLPGSDVITIGSADTDNVSLKNIYMLPNHFKIVKNKESNFGIEIALDAPPVYVNGKVALNGQLLSYGDEIYAFGLKIIWMLGFVRINELEGLSLNGMNPYSINRFDNTKVTEITNREKYSNLYKDNDYFFHRPNLKPIIENVDILIDPPPAKVVKDQTPLLLTMGASLAMSIATVATGFVSLMKVVNGESTVKDELLSIVMCVSMLLATLLFPVLTHYYDKSRNYFREKKRIKKYSAYLETKEELIKTTIKNQENILNELYVTQDECCKIIDTRNADFWSREIKDANFLMLRVGIGNLEPAISISFQKSDFVLDDDKLLNNASELASSEKYLMNVPITASLKEDYVLPFIVNNNLLKKFADYLMLQLITFHSHSDLKLVFFVSSKNSYIWDNYKYLTYSISDEYEKRFFAYDEDEMKDISSYLEKIYVDRFNIIKNRASEEAEDITNPDLYYTAFDTYYLIITDDSLVSKDIGIVDRLLKANGNYGFSLLMFETALKNLPSRCNEFINISEKEGTKFSEQVRSDNQQRFVPEFLVDKDLYPYIYTVSNIPVAAQDAASVLPPSLEFLEMFKVGKIEQLNIGNRWNTNNPTSSLAAPVGVHPNGNLLELNLHEKMHGPHGLIAGSTGSGKSEFIITYILSMCINYSPLEVQFVLIDYKGGGLAGAFENREKKIKIPHLVGTITNLDTSEMNRTLVSIRSELKRRQRIFNETRDALGESTIDIYKYQKYYREGVVHEPIAHLFIISDEFAELKAQQPDFMDELISTARIGRSLGVHLILATQKPSGVVDDQIWSNTKFKVCLKVQSEADSNEMLRRPDAASIKETGRFYLQVGSDDIFEIGQSAWSGAKYIPSDTIMRKIDDSINIITNTGNIIKSINDTVKVEEQIDKGEQLTNIVKYLIDLAAKDNIVTNQLWLPSIPNEIYIGNIIKKYNFKAVPFDLTIPVGEYDDPEHQTQGLLTHNLLKDGNTILYGVQGSGKENFISTMMYVASNFHSPLEINFYILDFGSEILKVFNKIPHVGEYITSYELDKISSLFQMLEKEFNKRKDILSDFGGNFEQYNEKEPNKLPLIYVILNNYEGFIENAEEFFDTLVKLLREGLKFGIVFLITSTTTNGITGRLSQNCSKLYGFRFNDDFDYRFVLNAEPGLVPKKIFGRGLTSIKDRVLEFQTANINLIDIINDVIKASAQSLASLYKVKAKSIPVIPSKVNKQSMLEHITDCANIPIGINMNDISLGTFDFKNNRIIGITGNNIQIGTSFVEEFLKLLIDVPDINIVMLDLFRTTEIPPQIKNTTSVKDFMEAANAAIPAPEQPEGQRIVIITGVGEIFDDEDYVEEKNSLSALLNDCDKYPNTTFVLIDNYLRFKKIIMEDWYQNKYDQTFGIWIGGGVDSQVAFTINGLTSEDSEQYTDDVGYLIKNGRYEFIKIIESDG